MDESSSLSLDLSIFFAVAGVEIKSIEETLRSVSRDLWDAGRLLFPSGQIMEKIKEDIFCLWSFNYYNENK